MGQVDNLRDVSGLGVRFSVDRDDIHNRQISKEYDEGLVGQIGQDFGMLKIMR